MDERPSPHVMIIGAGITGLLIAQGLKKEGIKCTIFESEPSALHYRPREWGMSIQWGIPLLQDCLPRSLFDRLYTASVDPFFEPPDPGYLPTWNGATGELIKNIPLLRMYRVSRRKFRGLCADGIHVEYGKTLKKISYDDIQNTVTALFEDGSQAAGTLLIGADGAQSVVRTLIFGPKEARASTAPISAINLHVKYKDAEKSKFVRQCHPIMTMAIHPDGYWLWISIQEVPDPEEPATWTFQLQTTWKKRDGEEVASLENLKKKAETFGEPFRSANLWIPEGTKIYENKLSYWNPVPWDHRKGRIILAGDAAHPMTFQRGQGMNHGIADASKLTRCLKSAMAGEMSWEEAISDYQEEMIDRAGDEVATSKENTDMLHDWSRMQHSPIMQRGGHPRENRARGKAITVE